MTEAPPVVLDASALLAALHGEPGGQQVEACLERATISAVNWAEVLQKSLAYGVLIEGLRQEIEALGCTIIPFTVEDAEASSRLWPQTRAVGLSLADRACIALALRLGAPAITADRAWSGLQLGVPIMVVR